MDSELEIILRDIIASGPQTGPSGYFNVKEHGSPARVVKYIRDGKVYISVFLDAGGMIGFYADDAVGDIAPFCD